MKAKYPDIKVSLIGQDGNAFSILGVVKRAMKKAEVPADEINEMINDMIAEDYDHLLQTVVSNFNVE